MRHRPHGRHVVALALGIVLALSAGPPRARAGKPEPPATIVGTVVRDDDNAPVAFANVVVDTLKLGAATDKLGRFIIMGVPPGRVTLRIVKVGDPPVLHTLDLAPGDTVRGIYRLPSPQHQHFLHIRDSLTARGLWPRTLDAALYGHMREALDVRVFRLDPKNPVFNTPPDRERRIGPWPIVGESPRLDRAVVDELIEVLRDSDLYIQDIEGAVKECGGFSPLIDVRFTNLGVPVDVLLCYKCEEFAVWWDGINRQTGDFMGRRPDFERFAKRVFPKDPEIKRLGRRPKWR